MSESLEVLAKFLNHLNQDHLLEYLTSLEKYKELKKYLKLQTLDTSKLIQLYYQEMISVQKSLKSSEYGELFCRAFYHLKEETLVIEG